MKTCLALLFCFLLAPLAQAQYEPAHKLRPEPLPMYLFEEFSPAILVFKSGRQASLSFNYNVVSEEMVFVRYGRLLALDMPDVDTIYIGERKFIPMNKGFYELVETPLCMLYIRHHAEIVNKGKSAGYGQHSETAAISSLNSYAFEEMVIPLASNAGGRLQDLSEVWLRRGGQFYEAGTKKQLLQAFPEHEAAIRKFDRKYRPQRYRLREVEHLLRYLQ
jgi:hypothetical protein